MVFVVYDIKTQKSFKEVPSWCEAIKNNAANYTQVFLIGNKCDMEKHRAVDKDEAEEYAKV